MRRLAALLLFLTSSCWVGPNFYARTTPQAPIPPGEYLLQNPRDASPTRLLVEILPDGFTRLIPSAPDQESVMLGFTPLPDAAGAYVLWVTQLGARRAPGDQTTFLAIVANPDRSIGIVPLICDRTYELAEAHGARVEPVEPDDTACAFRTREQLEAAVRARLTSRDPRARLIPVS